MNLLHRGMSWVGKHILETAGLVTLLWLAVAGYFLYHAHSPSYCATRAAEQAWCLPPNAIGDVMAGVFAPLAFIWFLATVFLQAGEIKENRKVMEDQAKALINQNAIALENSSLDQRPWLFFETATVDSLQLINPDGIPSIVVRGEYVIKNTGKSAALSVAAAAYITGSPDLIDWARETFTTVEDGRAGGRSAITQRYVSALRTILPGGVQRLPFYCAYPDFSNPYPLKGDLVQLVFAVSYMRNGLTEACQTAAKGVLVSTKGSQPYLPREMTKEDLGRTDDADYIRLDRVEHFIST